MTTRSGLTVLITGAAVAFLGVIAVLIGTFLPWLSSGGVLRNSYAIVGIVDRLGLVGTGFAATALTWWPFLGPVAMLCLIAGIVRLYRTAAAMTLVFGLLTGVIGGGVLAAADGHAAAGVRLAHPGPVTTVVGAALAILGAAAVLVALRRRRHRTSAPAGPGISVAAEPFTPVSRLSKEDGHGAGPVGRSDVAGDAPRPLGSHVIPDV